jgi:hypothetical protein
MTDKNLGPAIIEPKVYTKRMFNNHMLKNVVWFQIFIPLAALIISALVCQNGSPAANGSAILSSCAST